MSKDQPRERSPLTALHAPWDHNKNSIWLASTIRICRNLEKFKFPHKLEAEKKFHIEQLASKAALQAPGFINSYLLQADEISPAEKEFLIEHFLLFEGFQEAHSGSAFALDSTGETIVLFNIREHLQIQCTDCTQDLEKTWAKVVGIENYIAESVNFAFSSKFGYLTADPQHCGTGLIVSAFLHLPAIIHMHHLEKEKIEGIVATGIQGSPDEFVGDIVMIRNSHTIGLSEENIIANMRNALLRIVVAEKDLRSEIKATANVRLKDLTARAVGLIKHSYQLDAQEALNALSFLKLGIELGWVKGMSLEDVNKLFFDSRRSHLTYLLENGSQNEDISVSRARYLREKSSKLSFTA